MKKIVALAVAIVICSLVTGQNNYFSCRTIKNGNHYFFPLFSHQRDSLTVQKINDLLQISELYILKGHEHNSIFENLKHSDRGTFQKKSSITYSIESNTDKLLSIRFSEAGFDDSTIAPIRYYNFNAGNGDLIQLQDLFTKQGYDTFYQLAARKKIFHMKNKPLISETDQSCYSNCKLRDFFIRDSVLYIDGSNLLPPSKRHKHIETLIAFKLKEFRAYLNDYGKSLFSLSNTSIAEYHSKTLPQLFVGTIDKLPVIFVPDTANHQSSSNGKYVYLKQQHSIFFAGRLHNNELFLTGSDNDDAYNGFINVEYNGTVLTGTWADKDTTATYPIRAVRK